MDFTWTGTKLTWTCALSRPASNSILSNIFFGVARSHFGFTPEHCAVPRALLSSLPLKKAKPRIPLVDLPPTDIVPHTVLSCDACLYAGAVSYTPMSLKQLCLLWSQAYVFVSTHDAYSSAAVSNEIFLSTYHAVKWTPAVSYVWKHKEHIDFLEAAAALLAIKWAAQSGVSNQKLFLFTGSLVVFHVLRKGLSSSVLILLRCRKVASICIAYNDQLFVLYKPSKCNVADYATRNFSGMQTHEHCANVYKNPSATRQQSTRWATATLR